MSETKAFDKRKDKIYRNFIFGGIAGSVAKSVIAPLDRTKIYFQSTENRYSTLNALKFLKEIYNADGFFQLWRGNSATIVRIFPYAAIQYAAHEKYKTFFLRSSHANENHLVSKLKRFASGALAGMTSVSITYPLDFARARMALTKYDKYHNIIHALKTVKTEEGFLALYKGYNSALVGCVPYSGIAFFTFETLKEQRLAKLNSHSDTRIERLDPVNNLICGATAGILGQTASYPLDIVRRRMQTGHVTGHDEYSGIIKTLKLVHKNEGFIHGLYKGISMNWIKGPVASGISFTIFHQLQHYFE